MLRYAHPDRCPDCQGTLPTNPWSCPSCDLPLHGPVAQELFRTLQRADVLLHRLRTEATLEGPAPTPVTVRKSGPVPEKSVAAPVRRTGLRTASVPAILLGLGALCLLVAAITFLAVAWSWMGVGGRTGVLVGLTGAAAGAGVLLGRRGLRVAAESLTTVSLGLVALDVVGAITAGWVSPPDDAAASALIGSAVAVVSGAVLAARSRLFAPQLGATLGLVLAFTGLAGTTGHDSLVAFLAVIALRTAEAVGRMVGARVLAVSALLAAVAWWSWLLLSGLVSASADPSLATLWTTDNALPLLGAASLLLASAAAPSHLPHQRVACASGAATIVTLLLALPALDEGVTAVGLTLFVGLVAWSGIAAAGGRELAFGPLALAAVPALAWTATHVLVAADRVWSVGEPFSSTSGVRLGPVAPDTSPLLLVPLVAALLGAGWVVTRRPPGRLIAVCVVAVAAVATLASYGVALAAVVGALALAAVITARFGRPALATTVAVVAVSAALPSAGLTAAACAAAVTGAVLLLRARTTQATLVGGMLLPAASAGLVWSGAAAVGVAVDLRALPVLVVVGALAIARPRSEVEASAALAGLVASVASLDVAADQLTALAIHLTVAGVLVTLSSLVHAERRVLAWPGGALLAAATWARLADLGVEAPEAYTLPSALVLILVALHRLWRIPGTSTAVLLPGLTLATVPSLLWVLVDPVSPRAVLLGVACLALVLTGARLRWSAPLAVGAMVGGLLVVREVAPYASEMPQWVLIGFAGTILTVVGVTWEQRVLELRRATSYLGRLR
jgi:hypothetical protein